MKITIKSCEHCGTIFSKGRSDKKFCDTKCRSSYHNKHDPKRFALETLRDNQKDILGFLKAKWVISYIKLHNKKPDFNYIDFDWDSEESLRDKEGLEEKNEFFYRLIYKITKGFATSGKDSSY